MERHLAYNTLWAIEVRKLTATQRRQWALIIAVVLFSVMPWLTLRNFEEKFASFSWHYLDESVLNFVIYSTATKLLWLMIVTLPWIYYFLFSEEASRFYRKKNKLFAHLIIWKSMIYTGIVVFLIVIMWLSTLCVYRYWCLVNDTTIEPGTLSAIKSPLWHLLIRSLPVFPLMVVVFLVFPKKWSYIMLVFILIFSALLIFRLPFHFHFNVHRPEVNLEYAFHSILAGIIMTIGLILYYRTISKKTYVFP